MSTMKKKIIFCLSFVLIHFQSAYSTDAGTNIGIAAIVNNNMISKLQLKHRIQLAILSSNLPNTPQAFSELRPQILNIMIDEAIQLQLGETLGLKIQQAVLDNAISEIENQNNMPSGGLKKILASNHIPLEIMYNHLKANLIWRDYIRERYRDNVQVSDAEVNRMIREFETAKGTLRYDLYELVINYKDNKRSAIESMNKIISLYHKATPFPVLAKQFSNAASANSGGHVGWVSQSAVEPEVYTKIKNLDANEVSAIIDNGHSLTLYFVKERLEAGQLSKPETFLSFKQVLLAHDPNGFEFEIKDNLNRARAIARTIKGCRVVDKLKDSKNISVQNVENIPSQNIPPELLKILSGLNEDQASTPILTEQGALIFVLCKKQVNDPEEPKFEDTKEQLIDRKLQLIADREMRNRRKSAHIDRRN